MKEYKSIDKKRYTEGYDSETLRKKFRADSFRADEAAPEIVDKILSGPMIQNIEGVLDQIEEDAYEGELKDSYSLEFDMMLDGQIHYNTRKGTFEIDYRN